MRKIFKQKLAAFISVALIMSSMGTVTFAEGIGGLPSGSTDKLAASGSEADSVEDEEIKDTEKSEAEKKQEEEKKEVEKTEDEKSELEDDEIIDEVTEIPTVQPDIPEPVNQITFLEAEFEEEEEATPSEAEFMAPNKPVWMMGKNAPGGKNRPGWGTWTDDLTEEEKEQVQTTSVEMYRDGEALNGGNQDEYTTKADMRFWFDKPGEYRFRCVYPMTDDWEAGEEDWSEFSEPYIYESIGKSAPVPTGLKWEKDGGTAWDDALKGVTDYVAEVDDYDWGGCYRVKVYKKSADGTYDFDNPFDKFKTGRTQNVSRFDWDIYDDPEGTYIFTVTTIGDLVNYDYGAESLPSPEFYVGDAVSEAQRTLESLLNESDIKDAVENAAMTQEERDVLRLAVQTDKNTEAKLQELEEKYQTTAGKEALAITSGSSLIDGSRVSVIGGILNGAKALTFQPAEINDESLQYKKVIGLEISLEGAGGELTFPVLLTMPTPKGISANKLVVVHYKESGDKEYIYPRINGDGTISFAVTSFSEFAFVDTSDGSEEKPDNDGGSSSGSHGSSHSGGGGGGSSRSTASVGTSGTWIQDQYGWWFEKVGGSYPVSDWLMTTDGNWFRFDEKGYMMTGWFIDQAGNRFYLNPISDGTKGAMKTGVLMIDGKVYYFNPVSDGTKGAMKVGWQMIDGSWYYFSMALDETYGMMLTNATTPDGYAVGADGKKIE